MALPWRDVTFVQDINLTPTASYIDIGYGNGSGGAAATGSLPARTWGTPAECVAATVLVHGLGAHSGWFEALGRRLKVRRIFTLAYDQVGFGKRRSEQFISREQWFDDLATAFNYLTKITDKPIFIMGNSMGAAVAMKAVAERKVAPSGLVMFSPGFDGNRKIFSLQYKVTSLIKALLSPEAEIAVPYTPEMITRSQSVQAWLNNDPDRRFSPTGKMLLELLKMSLTLSKIRSADCPVLMMRAGIDCIVDNDVSKKVLDRLQCPSKKDRMFEKAWHDLMFDPVIDDLTDEVVEWMTKTAQAPSEKRLAGDTAGDGKR